MIFLNPVSECRLGLEACSRDRRDPVEDSSCGDVRVPDEFPSVNAIVDHRTRAAGPDRLEYVFRMEGDAEVGAVF